MMPTPEQIEAARKALAELVIRARVPYRVTATDEEVNQALFRHGDNESLASTVRLAFQPLPEPERPRITPTRCWMEGWQHAQVFIARAEIIAWLEQSDDKYATAGQLVDALLAALREADKP